VHHHRDGIRDRGARGGPEGDGRDSRNIGRTRALMRPLIRRSVALAAKPRLPITQRLSRIIDRSVVAATAAVAEALVVVVVVVMVVVVVVVVVVWQQQR